MFFSGHSLIDWPLPQNYASIASSLGRASEWNEQNIIGSPIRVRTRGMWIDDPAFGGYRTGRNRYGWNMDVVSELRTPQTIGGRRYDAMVLAERHDLPMTLQWEDTVRYTRHFHDRLIAGNPSATTYLYHAWLDVSDKSNPRRWIDYERTAATAWQCVASRINLSLANEGRADRVQYMPAALALAHLVEQSTQGHVEGISAGSVPATMAQLFRDNVHLTPLGQYYMSLVSFASVHRVSPVGAWVPPEVSAVQAQSLQSMAWGVVSAYYASQPQPSMATCQSAMRDLVCPAFFSYTGLAGQASCQALYATQASSNPFYFNAGSDRSYWFPVP